MALAGPEVPHGQLMLVPSYGQAVTLALAGDPSVSPAVGGWNSSSRYRRLPAKWWSGPDESGNAEFPLAADARLTKYPDVAGTLLDLEALGQASDGQDEPPIIQVICSATPTIADNDYVLVGMPLGAQVMQNGILVRQEVTVSLERHVPFEALKRVSQRATRSASNKRRARVIKSRQGDTLRAIAVRQLGSAGRWKDIREWNPKTLAKVDPDLPLRVGTRVVLR